MPRALFLDQSTTACGFSLAAFDDDWLFSDIEQSGVLYPPKQDVITRVEWLMDKGAELIETFKPAEVVIEDTRFSGGRTHGNRSTDEAMSALVFSIQMVARRYGIPVYRQAPSTIKLNGAGHGKAEKADMMIAASSILGREARDDNEADAVLAAISWGKVRDKILNPPPKKKKGAKRATKR